MPMWQHARRVLPLVATLLLLTGCAGFPGVINGETGAPGSSTSTRPDVSAQDFPITGVSDDPIDQFARNALADLNLFWKQAYPAAFGRPFVPLRGGYFSVDGGAVDQGSYPPTGIGCRTSPTSPD